MDFAPEPVLDAFTPPPTRQAPRAPAADDNGQTFNDHLDAAVNEPVRERPAPAQTEARDETAQAPVEAKPAATSETEPSDETLDPDVALLGGPLPPAPPPMAAPVVVQIAASQPTQQAPSENSGDAEAPAPIAAPDPAAPAEPAMNAEAEAEAKTEAPVAPTHAKHAQTEAKPAAPDAQLAQAAPQTTNAQAQAPAAPQTPATAPVAVEELPPAIQQAIAATIAPAPQGIVQTAQRPAKAAVPTESAKAAPSAPDGKPEAPAANANANAKANTPKASNGGTIAVDAAPVVQPQTTSSDPSQIAQSSALTTTSAQASSHVQHAAIDTGAQRATPAAAQVGREIIRRFDGGNTSFELRLDPAELGRVEVRMEVTRDHRVTAVITADNPQALTELARNARELEQQLQSAGLQLSENGLSFDLRQGGQGNESGQANANGRGAGGEETLTEQQPPQVARPIGYERWRGVRVDMMV